MSASRRDLVQEHLIELCVGETIQVGQYAVKLVEVDGDQLCFEIQTDDDNGSEWGQISPDLESLMFEFA